jgi:hypothetical protein
VEAAVKVPENKLSFAKMQKQIPTDTHNKSESIKEIRELFVNGLKFKIK